MTDLHPATAESPRPTIRERLATPIPLYIALVSIVAVGIGMAITGSLITAGNYEGPLAQARADLAKVTELHEKAQDVSAGLRAENATLQAHNAAYERDRAEVEAAQADLAKREADVKAREDAVAATEERIAANSFGSGTHVVGTDIEPGTYRAESVSGCYWARLANGGGGLDAIIANDNVDGNVTVTISGSDWGFQSNRCGTWVKVG